jgi:lactosylceramide 4-alpha-galactosyltransferase
MLLRLFCRDLIENFDGEIWGKNGPELLTRVLKKMCNIASFNSTQKCKNFTILATEKCYGVSWEEWQKFFEPHSLDYVRRHTKDSFFVHLWNKFSKARKLEKTSTAALNEIVRQFCPRVYESLDGFF